MSPHETAAVSTIALLVFGGGLGVALSAIAIGFAAGAEVMLDWWSGR